MGYKIVFTDEAMKDLGDFPCSTNENFPPGFNTLKISRRAISGLGILHKLHVETTESRVLSGSGMLSAEARRCSIENDTFLILS